MKNSEEGLKSDDNSGHTLTDNSSNPDADDTNVSLPRINVDSSANPSGTSSSETNSEVSSNQSITTTTSIPQLATIEHNTNPFGSHNNNSNNFGNTSTNFSSFGGSSNSFTLPTYNENMFAINSNAIPFAPIQFTNQTYDISETSSLFQRYKHPEPRSYEQLIKALKLDLKDAQLKASADTETSNPLQTLLRKHNITDINTPDDNGKTLLHYVVENNDVASLKILLEQKDIHVNPQDNNRMTPLHIAAEKGYSECVTLLLSHKDISINI